MGAIAEAPADQILIGDNIFEEYKGAFTEQYVLQQLIAVHEKKIYYYHPDNSRQEVDFMTQNGSRIAAIEVKAEENLRSKSLRLVSVNGKDVDGYRLSMSDFRQQDWMVNIPLYLAMRVFDSAWE